MNSKNRNWLRLLAALLAMAMVAAACGSDDGDVEETDADTEETDAETTDEETSEEDASEDEEASDDEEAMEDEEAAAGSLADCPNPMVFQTDLSLIHI